MISAKPVAALAVLALAGVLVAQESVDVPRPLPRLIQLLEDLPRADLEGLTVLMADNVLSVAKDLVNAPTPSKIRSELVHRRLKKVWPQLVLLLAQDYSRIRKGGSTAPIPLMQLLLLTQAECSSPEAKFLPPPANLASEVDLEKVAAELVSAGSTPQERMLGNLYLLHQGAPGGRVPAALSLGQSPELASDVVQHLIGELLDEDLRVVQEAITALGMIGPAAGDAIPILERLTRRKDGQIVQRAKVALKYIQGR